MKLLLLFIGVAMCMEAENSRLKQTNKALHEALNSLEESLGLDMEKNLADFGEDAVSRRFPSFRGRAPRRPSRPSRPSRPGTSRRRSSSGRNSRREDNGDGPDIFDAIDLVDFFAGGSGGNVEMEKVCHKDNCKGTWTNPLPRGEQWTLAARAGDSGCCSFSSGACDWCVPPGVCTPYSAEACRDAAQSAGLEEGGNGYAFEGDYSQKGCYAYETGEYANMAFYGTGGSDSEKRGSTNSDETFRPNGYDCTL